MDTHTHANKHSLKLYHSKDFVRKIINECSKTDFNHTHTLAYPTEWIICVFPSRNKWKVYKKVLTRLHGKGTNTPLRTQPEPFLKQDRKKLIAQLIMSERESTSNSIEMSERSLARVLNVYPCDFIIIMYKWSISNKTCSFSWWWQKKKSVAAWNLFRDPFWFFLGWLSLWRY